MILGIGCDIIELSRFKNVSKDFIDQVLTANEIIIYNKRKGNKQIEFIAGHFAAKEAIIKAFTPLKNLHMKEINIEYDNFGKPYVIFEDYKVLISISHCNTYTTATAIIC